MQVHTRVDEVNENIALVDYLVASVGQITVKINEDWFLCSSIIANKNLLL